MDRPLRILLLTASYPPVLGGLQTAVSEIARNEQRIGSDIRVITNHYPRHLPTREMQSGVPVERLQFLNPRFSDVRRGRPDLYFASHYFRPAVTHHVDHLFGTWKPDVVNVHFPTSLITPYVLRLRERFQFRLTVSLQGDDVLGYERMSIQERSDFERLLSTADAVTACSNYLGEHALHITSAIASRMSVIHNGVDITRFRNSMKHEAFRPYVVSFGRLVRPKGTDLLIEAFSQIASEFSEVSLVIAGDGPERAALEMQVASSSVSQRIHLVGTATPDEIVRFLNGAQFAVFPRREEAFGIAVLEAVASGKPTIATQVGGMSEFLDVPPNQLVQPTVDDIARGMRLWLSGSADFEAIGVYNRQRAAQFTWSNALARYHTVFTG